MFADATGCKVKARKRSGDPTPELKQVAGAMLDHEEVTEAEWSAGVRGMVANPPSWVDGPWIVGSMFGQKSAAHTIARAKPVAAKDGGLAAGSHLRVVGGRERVDWGAVADDLRARGM